LTGVDSQLLVIFGASGDLARKKLIPAVHTLVERDPANWRLLGVGNKQISDEEFQNMAVEALVAVGRSLEGSRAWCRQRLSYRSVAGGFAPVAEDIAELERAAGLPGNRVFYLALPPEAVPGTVEGMGEAGLHRSPGWTRLVIEKPFGRNGSTASELNRVIHRWFTENQIFRIDHYLGKETVRNLLVFRFANPLFESSWNRERIDHVQITVAEDVGVGTRAGYYDGAGALRDIVQNHLTQVMSLVAMEPPVRLSAQEIRDEKVKVLRAIYPVEPRDLVRGQYSDGDVGGARVPAYRSEPGVDASSTTETYVALKLGIDNWRWQGVPFYLRTGKRMPKRLTQIAVTFREPPVSLFDGGVAGQMTSDVLLITLQPDEGFDLLFDVKAPGEMTRLATQSLRFRYADAFGPLPEAYETLLYDVLIGDQTLFVRADEVEEAWRVYEPVLDGSNPFLYRGGTWGPSEADELVGRRGDSWLNP